jgi:simple sugar transport system ATP-binding protein
LLQVRAGEVVGIAGVSGNGQKELMYALSGEDTRAAPAMVQVLGKGVGRMGPRRRRALGLHFVPEERLGRGAVPSMGLAHNLLLTRKTPWARAAGSHGPLQAQARDIIRRFNVKAGGPNAAASRCRAAICRSSSWAARSMPSPAAHRLAAHLGWTWARQRRSGAMLALRDAGCAVLVVSEELDELFEICDRLHVVAKGA